MARDLEPKQGVLLIAPPILEEPSFRRTVVFLCEHTQEGSFGRIQNRPLGVHLADILEGVGSASLPLQQGGPVQTDTLHFLHTCGAQVPEAIPVADRIFWGGNFEALKGLIDRGEVSPLEVRFFLGYAGWSPGQLEGEVEQGGWIVARPDEDLVFATDSSELWGTTLRRLGGEYAMLANFPEDPRLN